MNAAHHYDVLEKWLATTGIGAWFDAAGQQLPAKEPGAIFKIIKPRHLISLDETVKLTEVAEHLAVTDADGVQRAQFIGKPTGRAAGYAAHTANGDQLTPFFLWDIDDPHVHFVDTIAGGPTGRVTNPETNLENHPESRHLVSETGRMDDDAVIPYFDSCILPHYSKLSEVSHLFCRFKPTTHVVD